MTERVHEEPTTGFLLGAFASLAPVCSQAFEQSNDAGCSWQYFPKSGCGSHTEAATGADFALIIEFESGPARLAIFQAKRVESDKTQSFDLHQVREISRTKNDETATEPLELSPTSIPQFLRLVAHAKKTASSVRGARRHLSNIHWTHYLVYAKERIRCVSLDNLVHVAKSYATTTPPAPYKNPGVIHMNSSNARSFFGLLTTGATPEITGAALKGWLEIQQTDIDPVRVSLLRFTDVYVARHGPAPDLKNTPKGTASSPPSPDAYTKDILSQLLEESDAELHRGLDPKVTPRSGKPPVMK